MIETLGNGIGYVYEVDPSGNIVNYWPNNLGIEMYLRSISHMKAPLAGEKRAFGQQTITTVTGASNITALNINAVDQLGGTVAVTAGNPTQTATDIVAQINATTPGSGPRFTAISQGAVITFLSPNSGTAENGFVIAWVDSVPGNVVLTGDSTIHDGSSPSGTYDTRTVMKGTRTFLNSSTGAAANNLTGATEITSIINIRGTQSPTDVQQITASASTITYTRNQQETLLIVQGGVNVEVINGIGAQAGDKVTIVGYAAGNGFTAIDRTVATAAGKNIVLDAAESYASAGPPDMLNLFYLNDNTLGFVFSDRQGAAVTTSKVRTAAATPIRLGNHEITVPNGGGSYALTPGNTGASPNGFNNLLLQGSPTLTSGYTVTVDPTDAIAGDQGWISGTGSAIDINGNTLTICGYSINAAIALTGAWKVTWSYDGSNLHYNLDINPQVADWVTTSMIAPLAVDTAALAADSVTSAKIVDGTIVTADLDPAGIDANTVLTPASISAPLLDASLNTALGSGLKTATLSLSAAQINVLNGTPITIVAAAGSGVYLEAVSAVAVFTWNSVVYLTNLQLNVRTDTAAAPQLICPDIIGEASDTAWKFTEYTPVLSQPQLIPNKALVVEVDSGDPTNSGDSTVFIYLLYRQYP